MEFPSDTPPGLGDDFSGEVRLFPLPNVVLFPNVLLPLHIFEPRYIQMTSDALAGDGLIAMALLKSGWEVANDDFPEIHSEICIGRIVHHVELETGHYNLVVQGLQRASIIEELPQTHLYRQASVELLEDEPMLSTSQEDQRRADILHGFRRLFPDLDVEHELHHVFESAIPLGILCDVFAYALTLSPLDAQRLLAEFSVDRRSRLLLELMEAALAKQVTESPREFPPPFSLN